MDIEKLMKKRADLKQKLTEIDTTIRELERAKDRQELAKKARLIAQKGFTLEQILAIKKRNKRASNA